jgi:hypothetical protein
MITRRNKIKKNKTIKIKPSLKILKLGYPLYASKSYEGSDILKYNKEQQDKYRDKCLMVNSSWFGDLEVAKSYKTKDNHIYRWKTKKESNLLKINIKNETFINNIFSRSKSKLIPTIELKKDKVSKIEHKHPYLEMTPNEKALFEFNFCFGFINIEEQYKFMRFIKYLIENKFTDVKRRDGKSILNKLKIKIRYYQITSFLSKKEKLNRLSFYDFDKHAIMNLCKIIYENNMDISGVYQRDDNSFWFPDLVVYKMNIQEYILFNPQDDLVYDKLIE